LRVYFQPSIPDEPYVSTPYTLNPCVWCVWVLKTLWSLDSTNALGDRTS